MHRTTYSQSGLTAVEFLIYASIIGFLLIFTVPLITDNRQKSQIKQARAITEDSVRQARRAARYYKTSVIMHIESDSKDEQGAITLTFPELQRDSALIKATNAFTLPPGIDIVSSAAEVHFDSKGEVSLPATLTIVSNREDDYSEYLLIE